MENAPAMRRKSVVQHGTPLPFARFGVLVFILLMMAGCGDKNTVVVYTALDEPFSRVLLGHFQTETGFEPRAVFDTESNKSVGLTARLLLEKNDPRCDVFWNNEIINTIRLARAGLFAELPPGTAPAIPSDWRDTRSRWIAFAARARVLLVRSGVRTADIPRNLMAWSDSSNTHGLKLAIAMPTAGTSATHLAVIASRNGLAAATRWLAEMKRNPDVTFYAGNKQAAQAVSRSDADIALTDTDDAVIEIQSNNELTMRPAVTFPDSRGQLLIPNTIALVKNAPHPAAGVALINYLLSADGETRLARGTSRQIPLNPKLSPPPELTPVTKYDGGYLNVDWERAADVYDDAVSAAERILK